MSNNSPTNKHLHGHVAVYVTIVIASFMSAAIAFYIGDPVLLLVDGGIIATVLVLLWYEYALE